MNYSARLSLKCVVAAILVGHASTICAATNDVYPEQSLDRSLKQLAARTRIQVVYLSDLTDGRTAPEVPSGLSVQDTLVSMLANTGLTFRFVNERTVAVESPDAVIGKPVTYARTSFEATPPIRLAQAEATAPPVHSPVQSPERSADKSATELSQVVVTGTRVADRTRLDTLAPVDVLTTENLSHYGTTELAQAMATAAPSMDFPRPAITDGTDHIRPATLRGLAPDQTLVLVNSKRRHQSALVNVNGSIGRGSAAVDLNAIPMAAVETVEVLRDGASAQYGSDAIAGVINLRLRDAREGGNASVTYGEYNTTVDTERGVRKEHDGATMSLSAWTGLPLGAEGFLTLSGEYRDRNPTSRGDFDARAAAPKPNIVTSRYGDADVVDMTFYANAGLPVGTWNLYGWLGYQQREGESAAFPRLYNVPNNQVSIYPQGFLPLIASSIDDIVLGLGMRGDLGEWDADFSVVYGSNNIDYRTEHSINGSLGAASPTSFYSGGIAYDQLVANIGFVRGVDWGLASPANLALGVEARREGYSISAGEPDSYRAGPTPPPGSTPGAQGFPGFQPTNVVDESRTAVGAYADLELQFTEKLLASGAVRAENYSDFGSAVTGKLAGRYDFVDAFAIRGTVSTGFRAPGLQQSYFTSTATNFISGNPVEVGTFPATSAISKTLGAQPLDAEKSKNFSLGAVFRVADFEATIDAYRIDITDRIVLSENLNQANVLPLLAPFSVGAARFFINGVDTTTKGIDLILHYALRTDAVGKFDLTLAANKNETEVTRLPSTNVLSALNPPPVLFGRINRLTFEEGTPDSKISTAVDWSVPYSQGTWGVSAKATRYGAVLEPIVALAGEQDGWRDLTLTPTWLLDLSLTASMLQDKLSMTIGADNVFDQYPETTPIARPNPSGGAPLDINSTNALAFSRYSPYGFNGRFYYARLTFNW
jgi:iron complex outermembrane recepter protein